MAERPHVRRNGMMNNMPIRDIAAVAKTYIFGVFAVPCIFISFSAPSMACENYLCVLHDDKSFEFTRGNALPACFGYLKETTGNFRRTLEADPDLTGKRTLVGAAGGALIREFNDLVKSLKNEDIDNVSQSIDLARQHSGNFFKGQYAAAKMVDLLNANEITLDAYVQFSLVTFAECKKLIDN